MNKYVVGFMFSPRKERVALIRKKKPEWQTGLLNGIGGKIEETDNDYHHAMCREFREETGMETSLSQWSYYAKLFGENDDEETFEVHTFAAIGDLINVYSITDEPIVLLHVSDIGIKSHDMVESVPWLIGLALDHLDDKRPAFAKIEYKYIEE